MDGGGAAPYTGCEHYKRSCQLQCSQCKDFFACRFCHDALHYNNPKLDPKLQHQLDRKAVVRVKCMSCQAEQAPAQHCTACSTLLGGYFCGIW
jgi:hypothetical protein